MTDRAVLDSIPHRPPFLFIDEVVSRSPTQITTRRRLRGDEHFFQGHYPGQPIMPGVLMCECALQAAALLLSDRSNEPAGLPVVTRMSDVKFKRVIRPEETLEVDVEIVEEVAPACYLRGTIRVEGQVACTLRFAVMQTTVP